ncbi:hypothetical protein [Dactylosporangium salmoneum]|uniref:Uncharacterized protein n=1 Tax=Dactylosporangium salmoneum TaxID=53361 RepID=A0ABP5T8K6_9ACTN
MNAADLPDGSIVAARDIVFIKNGDREWPWRGTRGGLHADCVIDDYLQRDGRVVRVGVDGWQS